MQPLWLNPWRSNAFHPQPAGVHRREAFQEDLGFDRRTSNPPSHRRPDLTTSDRSLVFRGSSIIPISNDITNINVPPIYAPRMRRVDPAPEQPSRTNVPELAHNDDEADLEFKARWTTPLSRRRDRLAPQQSRRIPGQRPAIDDREECHNEFANFGPASCARRGADATTRSSGLHRPPLHTVQCSPPEATIPVSYTFTSSATART